MDIITSEDEAVVHRALLQCLRGCNDAEERRSFLLIIESHIAYRTETQLRASTFYSTMQGSNDAIRKLHNEISQVKMEDQVSSLLLDSSPPDNIDESYLNLRALQLSDSSSDLGEESDLVDLRTLINEQIDPVAAKDNPIELYNKVNLDLDDNNETVYSLDPPMYNNVNNISIFDKPPNQQSSFKLDLGVLPQLPTSLTLNNINANIPMPITRTPGDTMPMSRTPGDTMPMSRTPGDTMPMSRAPSDPLGNANSAFTFQPVNGDHFLIIDDDVNQNITATRAPGSLVPNGGLRPALTPTTPTSPALNYALGSTPSMTVLRPKGHLPPPKQPDISLPPQVMTELIAQPTSLPQPLELPPREEYPSPDYQTTRMSRQNSDYYSVPSRKNSAPSRQDSGNSDGLRVNRSSSGEEDWSAMTSPTTHKGSTVYRSKRISHAQLQAFIEDAQLKSKLRELGSFYLISSCEDPNYYNISLSGTKASTGSGLKLLESDLPADNVTYSKTELTIDIYPELRESGYIYKLVCQLFPSVDVSCKQLSSSLQYTITGPNDKVMEIVTLIKFVTSLPDKKYGMLFKLHNRLTSSDELVTRLINTAQQITKTPVHCLDATKTEACKFLFVPGLCGQQHHFKLQKHLNVLVERLEEVESREVGEPEPAVEEEEEEVRGESVKRYTHLEMLEIRQHCTVPLPALVAQRELPIRVISNGV